MIRDVLVHLDGTDDDEIRLQHAEIVAASKAHLIGLFTNPIAGFTLLLPTEGGAVAARVLADLNDETRRQGDLIQQRLVERFNRLSVPNEIRRLDGFPEELAKQAASEARWADLFVTTRPYGGDGAPNWDALFEAVLFASGRAVYVVPPGRKPSNAIRRILVAWTDSRESARAVGEARPFIEAATRTRILLVDADARAEGKGESGADIAAHLGRYGSRTVEVEAIKSEERAVSEVILDQARRMSADLIVMGAYGHSRAREWVLGGATREMLEGSSFPILMAH